MCVYACICGQIYTQTHMHTRPQAQSNHGASSFKLQISIIHFFEEFENNLISTSKEYRKYSK